MGAELVLTYKNDKIAEREESENKIPRLVNSNAYLKYLKNKGYPVEDAIDSVLDKKQKEYNDNFLKSRPNWEDLKYLSGLRPPANKDMNLRGNYDLRFDGKKFEYKIGFKSSDDKSRGKAGYAIISDGDKIPNSVGVEFTLNDVKDEMRRMFIEEQNQKLAFLDSKINHR